MTEKPLILHVNDKFPDPRRISEAAKILRSGGLVAFPTETVYGLGVDSTNNVAIEKLNTVKKRPAGKPYALLIHSCAQVEAKVSSIPIAALRLMEKFWPGPLTIILQADDGQTIGFRFPDHPVTLALLKACDVPIAAPSANPSGLEPPKNAQSVIDLLGNSIDCLIDAGEVKIGEASTVVKIINESIEIVREGVLSSKEVLSVVE